MEYHSVHLLAWGACLRLTGTVFASPRVWLLGLGLVAVIVVTTTIVALTVDDPVSLKVDKFQKICTFLNFFVGLMLGFFMSSSMGRWYNCVSGFLDLLDSVRNLHMQLCALGVPEERSALAIRYTFLSAWLLSVDLHVRIRREPERSERMADAWRLLCAQGGDAEALAELDAGRAEELASECAIQPFPPFARLLPGEAAHLQGCGDPAGSVLMWAASVIGRLAQDGLIPPMASPTYGRIMNLLEGAHGGLRQIRATIDVQAPFVYIHMLALLVHVANIINAIGFGLTLGSTGSVILIHCGLIHHPVSLPRDRLVTHDLQDVGVNFFYTLVGPFLYQALLEICFSIAQPFDYPLARIPMPRLLGGLARDLIDSQRMAEKAPMWVPPSFSGAK